MVSVNVTSTLGDLASDLREIAVEAKPTMTRVVRKSAVDGNRIAKRLAKVSAGAHGKHYSDRFSAEAISVLSWEYGPSGRPQGEMSFEQGSRNSPGHYDLAKSADIIGPALAHDVGAAVDGLFWPS